MNANFELAFRLVPLEFFNTLYMSFGSLFLAVVLGLPLGVFLFLFDRGGIRENRAVYRFLSVLVNIVRSVPFAILMIILIPFTRIVVGTSLGTSAAIVPLGIAGTAFFARLVEIALKEIDRGIIESGLLMGCPLSLLVRLLLQESFPILLQSATLTLINLIGYSAMAGLIGGGGLGKIAFQYGYQRFNGFIMVVTLLLLLFLVQGVQYSGNRISRYFARRYGKL